MQIYVGPIMFLLIIFCTMTLKIFMTLKILITTVFYYVHYYVYKSIFVVICDLPYNLLYCIHHLRNVKINKK